MRALFAAVLAFAIAFAGCAGDDGDARDPTTPDEQDGSPGGPASPGSPDGDDGEALAPISFTLSTTLPCPDCFMAFHGATGCPDWMSGTGAGTRCDWSALPEEAAGRRFNLTGSTDPELEFFDACTGASATSVGYFSEAGDEKGKVPKGAGCVVVWDYIQGAASMTLTIT